MSPALPERRRHRAPPVRRADRPLAEPSARRASAVVAHAGREAKTPAGIRSTIQPHGRSLRSESTASLHGCLGAPAARVFLEQSPNVSSIGLMPLRSQTSSSRGRRPGHRRRSPAGGGRASRRGHKGQGNGQGGADADQGPSRRISPNVGRSLEKVWREGTTRFNRRPDGRSKRAPITTSAQSLAGRSGQFVPVCRGATS
jgi:hypothetical protein